MRLSQAPRMIGGLAASAVLVIATALHAGPPPQASAGTGTIKGRLVWSGATIPTPKIEVAKADPKVKDAVCKASQIVSKEITVDPKTKGIADALVYLVKPVGDYSAAEKELLAKHPEVIIDQKGCEFLPYVCFVHKDQKLIFKSSDPVSHNVRMTPFANTPINTLLAANAKLPYTIKAVEKRPTEIKCDLHPWMTGYVFIVDHPLVAVTQADGSFEITGVPPGDQQLVVWHSNPGYVNAGGNKGMLVKVTAGGVVTVPDFSVGALKKK